MRFHRLYTMLFAHHYPEDYHRCTFVSGTPVCRRCLFLYIPALIVLGLQFTPLCFPAVWDPLLMGLALPATLEFILERLGRLQYHPDRVILGSLFLALPLGKGFAYYLDDPWDLRFWGLILVFGIPAIGAALYRAWRDAHVAS